MSCQFFFFHQKSRTFKSRTPSHPFFHPLRFFFLGRNNFFLSLPSRRLLKYDAIVMSFYTCNFLFCFCSRKKKGTFCAKCKSRPKILPGISFPFLSSLEGILVPFLTLRMTFTKPKIEVIPSLIAVRGNAREISRILSRKLKIDFVKPAKKKRVFAVFCRHSVWHNSRFSFTLFCLLVFQHVSSFPSLSPFAIHDR